MRKSLVHALIGLAALTSTAAFAQPAGGKASPVERPIAGDFGMTFAFQGLAPMSVGGVADTGGIGRAFMAEIGLRYMIEDKWALPFSFGATMVNTSPPGNADAQTDIGLGFTIGFQRYFRTWRRIAPYFGARLGLTYVDPSGDKNYVVQLALGPVMGIEYFIADRVSLSMEYTLMFGFQFEGDAARGANPLAVGGTTVAIGTALWMGGKMGLTFYF